MTSRYQGGDFLKNDRETPWSYKNGTIYSRILTRLGDKSYRQDLKLEETIVKRETQ